MKKIILILVLALANTFIYAGNNRGKSNEKWIDVGLRGFGGASGLLNTNALADKTIKYQFPFGYSGGLKIGMNFGDVFSVGVEGLYSVTMQKIKGTSILDNTPYNWNRDIQLSYIEIPLMLRFKNPKVGTYYEIGAKYGMLQSAKGSLTADPALARSYSNEDLKPLLNSTNMSIVFGLGSDLWGTTGMVISTGLRFAYGLSDITKSDYNRNFPYPLDPQNPSSSPNTADAAYKATNLIQAGIQINIEYDLGTFMSSSCGRSHKFVLFGH